MTREALAEWRTRARTEAPRSSWWTDEGNGSLRALFDEALPALCPAARAEPWPASLGVERQGAAQALLRTLRSTGATHRGAARVAGTDAWLWSIAWLAWPSESALPPWPAVLDPEVSGWLCAKVEGAGTARGAPADWRRSERFTPVLRWATLSQFADPAEDALVAAQRIHASFLSEQRGAAATFILQTEAWPDVGDGELSEYVWDALTKAGAGPGDRVILVRADASMDRIAMLWGARRVTTTPLSPPGTYEETLPAKSIPRALSPEEAAGLLGLEAGAAPYTASIVRALEEEPEPTNRILYGPPGTGKTWTSTEHALRLCGIDLERLRDQEVRQLWFEHLKREDIGRVALVTFHPAFEYEDFIEGLVPHVRPEGDVTSSPDRNADLAGVRYVRAAGVFKKVARTARAAMELDELRAPPATPPAPPEEAPLKTGDGPHFDDLWDRLIEEIAEGHWSIARYGDTPFRPVPYTTKREGLWFVRVSVDSEGNVVDLGQKGLGMPKQQAQTMWEKIQSGEISNNPEDWRYTDFAAIIGWHHSAPVRCTLERLLQLEQRAPWPAEPATDVGRAQAASPRASVPLQYVLVIDEINRGNIARIFGELLTLIEPTKRFGMPEQTTVQLPGSKEPFSVPRNLHILGTMNTADRSIALLDVALRRRFRFHELMPDEPLVKEHLEAARVAPELPRLASTVLRTINRRLTFLYDRDHQIGHSYFLRVRTWAQLRDVMIYDIVPLLQEYFYGSWDRVCLVLGCPYDPDGKPARAAPHVRQGSQYAAAIIAAELMKRAAVLGGVDHDDYEDRLDYRVNEELVKAETQEALWPFFEGILDAPLGHGAGG